MNLQRVRRIVMNIDIDIDLDIDIDTDIDIDIDIDRGHTRRKSIQDTYRATVPEEEK